MFVAHSLAEFKQRFSDGLSEMLMPDALGAYILVLANSLQTTDLRAQLAAGLQSTFSELERAFKEGTLKATADDIAVFEKLLALDPDNLTLTRRIEAGDWLLLLNTIRGLRPARAAKQVITDLQQPFNPEGFHFNKAFLQPEVLWQGILKNSQLRVLYNKFPLAPYHLLIAPDPEQCMPQFLSQKYHRMAAELVVQQQDALPGLYLGYNSLGAYASVNHLHFHAVLREQAFPVEAEHWVHRGGACDYPLSVRLFDSIADSWGYIEALHAAGQTYNVLYTHYGIYLLVRKAQNTVEVPVCMQGAGWPELCGEVALAAMPEDMSTIAAEIAQGLGLLKVN
jgi:diadenosine tetraphosphate (Ap4A) HIT family hydrolase